MAVLQWNAIPPRKGLIFTPPINSDSRRHRLFRGAGRSDDRQQKQTDSDGFHSSSQPADAPVRQPPYDGIVNDSA